MEQKTLARRNAPKLTGEQRKEITELYHFFKAPESKFMTKSELGIMMRALGVHITHSDIPALITRTGIDSNTDSLPLNQVFDVVAKVYSERDSKDDKTFSLFSLDGQVVNIKDLKRVAKEIEADEADVGVILGDDDLEGRFLDEQEFYALMNVINVSI